MSGPPDMAGPRPRVLWVFRVMDMQVSGLSFYPLALLTLIQSPGSNLAALGAQQCAKALPGTNTDIWDETRGYQYTHSIISSSSSSEPSLISSVTFDPMVLSEKHPPPCPRPSPGGASLPLHGLPESLRVRGACVFGPHPAFYTRAVTSSPSLHGKRPVLCLIAT